MQQDSSPLSIIGKRTNAHGPRRRRAYPRGSQVAWAIAHAPLTVREVLLEMPAREVGKSRVDAIC